MCAGATCVAIPWDLQIDRQEQLGAFQESLLSLRLCLPVIVSAFKPILLKCPALPGALLVCSPCRFHSEDPSISFWNKALLCRIKSHPITADGKRMQRALLFVHGPSCLWEVPLFEMNEADKTGGFKSSHPPLGFSRWKCCAALFLESKKE